MLLIDLPMIGGDGEPGRLYRIGTVNFSAILHYNRSYFYAAAVTEFAAALRERRARRRSARADRRYSASGCREGCASMKDESSMQCSKIRISVGT